MICNLLCIKSNKQDINCPNYIRRNLFHLNQPRLPNLYLRQSFLFPITLAGIPTAMLIGGMSLVTTLQVPITLPRPIVTPGKTVTLEAIHT